MPESITVAVHGRFQPFHLGHVNYLRAALENGDRLVVGITNYDATPAAVEPAAIHRHRFEANPFSYFERQRMVLESLADLGIGSRLAGVVPFPIQALERLHAFVPIGAVHVVRVWSEWEAEKVRRLRNHGCDVIELRPEGHKDGSGTEVRGRIRSGSDWESLVPAGTARVIRSLAPPAEP